MRIALDLLCLIPGEIGGTATYARGLCEGLSECIDDDEVFLYLNQSEQDWPLPADSRFHKIICGVSGRRRFARYCYEQLALPLQLHRDRIDVVHSLGNVSPLFTFCRSVVTISDLHFKHFAKDMSFARWAALRFFVPSSIRKCDQVITVSEFSRTEICADYPWVAPKIHVTHLASGFSPLPSPHDTKTKLGIPSPYFVAFSSTSPHKNLDKLIEVYAELRSRKVISHTLVIVGSHSSISHAEKDVIFTGYLPNAMVRTVLGSASFLVFPSLYEGFGLPLLEAMALGVPVACSTAGSLPEVAGEAALFFSPTSKAEIRGALTRIARDKNLRDSLRAKGHENLKRFSWRRTAELTYQVLQRATRHASRENFGSAA